MFIVGLVVGPALGLVAGDYVVQNLGSRWWAALMVALFVIFVVFAPVFSLELKVSLIFGSLLGLLLAASPYTLSAAPGDAE